MLVSLLEICCLNSSVLFTWMSAVFLTGSFLSRGKEDGGGGWWWWWLN